MMEPASCPVAPRDSLQNLLESSGLLWRELKSRVAARDSSKEATRGMLDAGGRSLPGSPAGLLEAFPGDFLPPVEGGRIRGSNPRLFQERTAVWDAVAGYVQDQLLLHKEGAKSLSSGGLQSNSPLLGASGTGWGQLRLSYAHHIASSPHKQGATGQEETERSCVRGSSDRTLGKGSSPRGWSVPGADSPGKWSRHQACQRECRG
ncbi:uncharacterized protein J5F26_017451 isoform 2-T5 [Ciconia maguari]